MPRTSLEELTRLKDKVGKLQREADKAQGLCEKYQRDLEEGWGVSSLKDAKKLLAKLQEEERELEERFREELQAFEEEYGDLLDQ